MQAIQSMTM